MADSEWIDDPYPGEEWVDDQPVGMTESGLRGLAQGGSLGFADEITGALESLFSDKTYEQARDESRANYAKAKESNPSTYLAGEVGGGIGTAFIPGLNIVKGASLAKTAGQAALQGGLMGAGYSEADNIGAMAIDAGKGAALGGTLGAGVGATAKLLSPHIERAVQGISSGSGDMAERFAARALGAERGTIKKLGIDKVKGAGRQALDEGVLSPLASTDDLIARNTAVKSSGGKMMGEAYDAIDSAGASTFNPTDVANKVDDELGGFYRSPINRGETNQLENTLEAIRMRGDGNIPLREAQVLKQELGKVANWKNNLPPTDKEKMAREAYGIVSSQIDDAVAGGAEVIESAGLSETLKRGKELYGNASTAEQLLQNKQAREQGNKILGLTDWGVLGTGGVGAAVTGGASIPATLGLMGVKKGLERFGSQNAALGLDKISKTLMKSPKMAELYNRNPQVFNNIVQKMESKLNESGAKVAEGESKPFEKEALLSKTQGTKYSQVLEKAAQRGDRAMAATNFILQSTDPEYRKKIFENEDSE